MYFHHTLRDHVIRVGAPRDMPVYFPAFAGTKLYCLVTEAGCEQRAYGAAASRPGLEPATTRSQVRRPTTKSPCHPTYLLTTVQGIDIESGMWFEPYRRLELASVGCGGTVNHSILQGGAVQVDVGRIRNV